MDSLILMEGKKSLKNLSLGSAVPAVCAWLPESGKRKQGGQKKTWRRTFGEDIKAMGLDWKTMKQAAQNRETWKN